MHDNRLVNPVAELGEELRGGAWPVKARAGAARQQVIDGGAEGGDLGVVGMQLHPPLEASADGDPLQLMGELLDGAHFSALKAIQHQQKGRYEREQ